LRQRAWLFLEESLPDEIAIGYVPGSLTEMIIGNYASGGKFTPELVSMAKLCLKELDHTISSVYTEAARDYFIRCRRLLTEILQEVS
ncbi:MAG: hypothetical protein K6T35_01565, partial [Meiothermus silvanus]|nr:hypothetical protein [Allomeiothermus silvanus]